MITLTAVSGAERKPDGKSSAVGPASHQSFNGATKKTRKPSPTCDRTYKQRKRLHLQRGEKGGILSSWCLGISALISVEGGWDLCLGGSYVHVDLTAAHSIFGCLLQGRDSKTRQGTVHPPPTNLWQTLIHCVQEPGPIHANGFDLAVFIPTLPLCERPKV